MNQTSRAMLTSLACYQLWVVADVFAQAAGKAGLPFYQMNFVHMLTSGCLIMLFILVRNRWHHLRVNNKKLVGARTFLSVFNLSLSFYAISHLPLYLFYTIVYLIPLLTAVLARFFLREKLEWQSWLAIGLGLVGALIAISGNLLHAERPVDLLPVLAAVTGALIFSCNQLIIRKASVSEHKLALATYPMLAQLTVGGLLCLALPHTLVDNVNANLNMVASGILGLGGLLLNLTALSMGRTAPVVAMIYTQLLGGALWAWILYAQLPNFQTIVGASVIVCAGMYLLWHQARPRNIPDATSTAA